MWAINCETSINRKARSDDRAFFVADVEILPRHPTSLSYARSVIELPHTRRDGLSGHVAGQRWLKTLT